MDDEMDHLQMARTKRRGDKALAYRRRRKKHTVLSVPAGLYKTPIMTSLLSNSLRVTLKYSAGHQLNPGTLGVAAAYVYRASSAFDPDFTGVGGQPRGFDELMALYDHFTVMSSKAIVTFLPGSQQVTGYVVGVSVLDNSTALTLASDYLDTRNVSYRGLSANPAGCGDAVVVRKSYNAANFMGRPDPASEDNLRGSSGANPADNAFFHIFAGPTYSTDGAACDLMVQIYYDILFTEPKQPPAS